MFDLDFYNNKIAKSNEFIENTARQGITHKLTRKDIDHFKSQTLKTFNNMNNNQKLQDRNNNFLSKNAIFIN